MASAPSEEWVDLDVQTMAGQIGLSTNQTSERLNQIDRVRALGVAEHIDLPQLVVCGDQSAGKSSVLEGITGIPFPRQEGICTKFATEIILRHQLGMNSMTATIFPSANRTQQEKGSLKQFRRALSCFDELPQIIEEASDLMGIRGHTTAADAPTFTADVLRLEIVGNTGLHLTVVDVPGLISGADDESDSALVEELVTSYMKKSRTIILAVIQANNDIETETIIRRAKKFDRSGDRTVGIVTKPDLINEHTEARVAALSRDRNKLKLGFFLLKNPTPSQLRENITWQKRIEAERLFFDSSPWKEQVLDKSRIGAGNLRIFLQELLDRHIELELPKVRGDIQELLTTAVAELKQLGIERTSIGQKRMFLTGLSMEFYSISKAALDGNYYGRESPFFEALDMKDSNRLRAIVHMENMSFADYMQDHSEKRKAKKQDDRQKKKQDNEQLCLTPKQMRQWVKTVYHATRGRELPGNYNHVLLSELYHEQSSHWGDIGRNHLRAVTTLVSRFAHSALHRVVTDVDVRRSLQVVIDEKLQQNYDAAEAEFERLLGDEQFHPITYNHYFTDNIQKSRQDKMKKQITSSISRVITSDFNGHFHVKNSPDEINRLVVNLQKGIVVDMDEQACTEALDGLRSYYKVARKTFVDNMCRQVIERHVLDGLAGAFDPVSVSEYEEVEVERITAETPELQRRRKELADLKQTLECSLRELRE
ncbi:dynamin GTPase [Rhizodiscina lignyota]|uniref:Dynamin GTPase n=1 Tax=Rhizodiscina lignyota TaxID=1504668 RepID=A0A9P4M2Z8_9PEZI|nr:dynamin GTPase [Rhizodiscina lignyota]